MTRAIAISVNMDQVTEALGQNDPREHDRRARSGIRRQRTDLAVRNLRNQQNRAHGTMTGDPCPREILQTLPRHFDHREDADVRFAARDLIGAHRRQGVAKVECILQSGRVFKAPDKRNRV